MSNITYLVANYNNGRYIADLIASLQAQTNANWRCLIMDDGSIDDSVAIILPHCNDQISLLTTPVNRGKTTTLARLIEHATTDIVAMLDADDALCDEATDVILTAYQAHPKASLIYSNHTFFEHDINQCSGIGHSRPIPLTHSSLTSGFVHHLITFRRSAYMRTPGVNERMQIAVDRDLVYLLEEVGNLVFIDKILHKWRKRPDSLSHTTASWQQGRKNWQEMYRQALNRRHITGLRRWGYWVHFHTNRKAFARNDSALKTIAGLVLPYVNRWATKVGVI